jgi:5'-methylthioadenosine phosphorylase
MANQPILGIIGGSGLYNMPLIKDAESIDIDTPFGIPSAPVVIGKIDENKIAFLARHGIGHHISPTEVNYRANIYALKSLGVTKIVSISACGSLREDYAPGHIVIPDQLFDVTRRRELSFFGEGLVVHIGTADPYCENLCSQLFDAVKKTGAEVHMGGTLVTIEGPRFSTKAESNVFRSWGMSIIGMTAIPEAFLAREAEICYATMAHVTDYDVWHVSEEPVTVEMVIRTLQNNTQFAQKAIVNLVHDLKTDHSCEGLLADAIITNRDAIPEETKSKLSLLVGKYLQS